MSDRVADALLQAEAVDAGTPDGDSGIFGKDSCLLIVLDDHRPFCSDGRRGNESGPAQARPRARCSG